MAWKRKSDFHWEKLLNSQRSFWISMLKSQDPLASFTRIFSPAQKLLACLRFTITCEDCFDTYESISNFRISISKWNYRGLSIIFLWSESLHQRESLWVEVSRRELFVSIDFLEFCANCCIEDLRKFRWVRECTVKWIWIWIEVESKPFEFFNFPRARD